MGSIQLSEKLNLNWTNWIKLILEVRCLLTLENVSKTYRGGKKAVNNVNLKIAKGEFICFIGRAAVEKRQQWKWLTD